MTILKIAGTCAALFASGPILADDSGPYFGAGVGQATEAFTGYKDSDTAFKVLGGYSFNKYLAAEIEYIDGGTQKDTVNGLDLAIQSDGFVAAVLGKWPVTTNFSPYVKFGYAFYDTAFTLSNGTAMTSGSESDSDMVFAGGLELELGDKFRLRAEFEKINVPDASFEIVSVAATFQF